MQSKLSLLDMDTQSGKIDFDAHRSRQKAQMNSQEKPVNAKRACDSRANLKMHLPIV